DHEVPLQKPGLAAALEEGTVARTGRAEEVVDVVATHDPAVAVVDGDLRDDRIRCLDLGVENFVVLYKPVARDAVTAATLFWDCVRMDLGSKVHDAVAADDDVMRLARDDESILTVGGDVGACADDVEVFEAPKGTGDVEAAGAAELQLRAERGGAAD